MEIVINRKRGTRRQMQNTRDMDVFDVRERITSSLELTIGDVRWLNDLPPSQYRFLEMTFFPESRASGSMSANAQTYR